MHKNKTMLGAAFTHEVTNVSKIFGRDHDINVIIEGDQAGVDEDGNIIYPSIDQNAQLSEHQIKVSRGYVDHECGHKRHTDLKAFFRFGRKCRREGKGLLMGIANAMEDPRMEACVIKDYQGSFDNLTATANEVSRSWSHVHIDEVRECQSTGQRSDNWHHYVAGALSIMGRKECWGFEGKDYDEALETFQALLGDEAYNKCQAFTKQLGKCKTTKQVLKLAEKVGEWIVDSHQQDSQPDDQANSDQDGQDQGQDQNPDSQNSQQSSGQGTNSDTSDQDSDTSGDNSDTLDQDADGNQSSASDNSSEGMDSDSQSDGDGQASDSQTQNNQVGDNGNPLKDKSQTVDVQDALNNTLGSQVARSTRCAYKPFTNRFDLWHTRKGANQLAAKMRSSYGLNNFKRLLSDSAGKLNVIRRKLERALQCDRNVNWDGGQLFGRLDSRRLVAAFNRQEKVYRRKQEAPALDTAVTILLDMSYSMNGQRIQTATQTLICLAEALEKTSINYNILGHSINMDHKAQDNMQRAAREHMLKHRKSADQMVNSFSRFSPLDMFEFKAFNERLGTAKTAIGNIQNIVNGTSNDCGNADSEAVMEAYRKLAQRPEKKKVLIVLSDGCPNTCVREARAMAIETLASTVKDIENRGIDVIGIGIQSDEGRGLYKNWIEVYTLDDLAETVIDQLGAALLGKASGSKGVSRRTLA